MNRDYQEVPVKYYSKFFLQNCNTFNKKIQNNYYYNKQNQKIFLKGVGT